MNSLEKINSLLDGREQNEFNRFVESLAVNNQARLAAEAWAPSNNWRKEKVLFAARNSGRFDGLV
ncbi:hypothetical protein D3C77_617720 [compost metagenome]